jgi:chloramphenicol 3-O-phosphotransferase
VDDRLNIVTGAPGAGKSSALEAFLALRAPFVAWDIDWLLPAASALARTDIRTTSRAWPPYNRLWLDVLRGVVRNGGTPVLFSPLDPRDLAPDDMPSWCGGVRWLLLDCSDEVRIRRLNARGETAAVQAEALADAAFLRSAISACVDTGVHSPAEVAARILRWLQSGSG